MKEYLMIAILCLHGFFVKAQEIKDTLRNIELPAALIKGIKNVSVLTNFVNNLSVVHPFQKSLAGQIAFQDLPYILNQQASVVITSDAGTGTGYTGIRIRGSDLTRINVTMNGVPVNDAESQATYFVDMPDLLSSTKEIQMSKGVGNSKNGVGNFGASIAINNLDVDQIKPSFLFQTEYGSFHTWRHVAKLSTGLINDKLTATVRLSNVKSDGFIQRSSSNLKGLQLTSKYQFNKNTQVVFNYLQGKEITGQAWNGVLEDSLQTNRTYNELGNKGDGTFYNNQTDNYGQQNYQLFIDKKLNAKVSIGSTLFYTKGKGYYEEYKMDESFADYYLPDLIQGADTISSTDLIRRLWLNNDFYGGRIYSNYVSKKIDAGLYFNLNQYDGEHFGEVIWSQYMIPVNYKWYDLNARKNDLNFYGMFEYRFLKNFSVFTDMQVRNVHYRIHGFRNNPGVSHRLNYLFFSPKVKLTYQSGKQISSLLIGTAQKEPNREDFEAGNVSIPKPERLFNMELNYARLLHKRLTGNVTLFLMYYKDQLVLTGKLNDVGAYTRSNVPVSYRFGTEIAMNWKPAWEYLEMKATLAFSQNKIKEFIEYIDDYDQGTQIKNTYTNTDISFSPPVVASAQVSIYPFRLAGKSIFKKLSVDLLGKYVDQQYLDNTANKKRILNRYFYPDLICNFPVQFKQHINLNFKAGVYNIFNAQYEANGYTFSYQYMQKLTTSNYYYPQAGRRFMVGTGLEF